MTALVAPQLVLVAVGCLVGVFTGLAVLLAVEARKPPLPTPRPPAPDETAPCPGCGRRLHAPPGHDPLGAGCPVCGWVP